MTKVKDDPHCHGCPMQRLFPENNVVPPSMGPSLRLVVAEAPGVEEDAQLEPLVGGSGKIFDALCRKASIPRASLTVLNTINCRPPGNLYPTDSSARGYCSEEEGAQIVAHCYEHHVKPVLDSRPWVRIDALGEKALRLLTGKTEGIMKWRGSPLCLVGEDKPRVIPTLHPAYIMRDQAMTPAVISDLKKGLETPPEFYNLQPTVEELEAFVAKAFTFDIETNRFTNQILMVGVSAKPYHVMVVPFQGAYVAQLKRIFAQAEEVVGQNIIAFDLPALAAVGIVVSSACQLYDTMLMQHLLQPDMPHDLEFISSIFTQKPAWKHEHKVNLALYNARDVDVTAQAFRQLLPLLKRFDLLNLYKDIQVPLAKICKVIHDTGLRTDPARADAARDKFLQEMSKLEKELPEELRPYDKSIRVRQPATPGTLNKLGKPLKFTHVPGLERVVPWRSPKLVEKYLYETLGLPRQLNAKTKRVSTDKTALEKLFRKSKNPVISNLQQLRKLDELVSTFFKEDTIGPGRVYPNLLVHGTSSGRLSSSAPNLQNQPEIARYVYTPSYPDWCYVEADFSQGENRLVACYADDQERLARLSQPGWSEHKWNASQFFGIPYEEVVKDNNRDAPYGKAKAITHGSSYGMGPRKLSMLYDLPEKEVRDLLLKWKLANPKTVAWQERTAREAEQSGLLTTAFGRKRWFGTSSLYTESLSFLPQSTLADMSFRAMISLMYERIGWPEEKVLRIGILAPLPKPARLLLQVHDSLLVECPQHMVHEVVLVMKAAMEQPFAALGGLSIPVEFKVGGPGESWGELKPYGKS